MVDFEGGKRGGFERDDSINDAVQPGSNGYQDSPASASAGTRILVADANGVVTLPAGTTLDNFAVVGRDLVITLADGSTIIIPDGAINTPQIVIDGTALSPLVVSAALNGLPLSPDEEGFNPEDLPGAPPSSGGDFEDSELNLQAAFDLGDLLPYTELFFEPQPEEEIIPFDNNEPDVVIETPDNPVGVENAIAKVAERGLPERGDEPEGTADETTAETTTGTIVFNSPDGISAIILNGVEITSVGQQFTTPFGTLTITSINLAAGEIGFSYTLADNLLGETEDGNFFVTVVDRDGDTASASLKILVEDDSPIAADDIGIVPSGSHAPIGGNVLVNDESGADDYPVGEGGLEAVVSFAKGATTAQPGETIQGEYGKLTLNADGTYTYVRDFNTPGGVSESFTYTITDQDGSRDTATLTINIADAGNNIELPKIGDGTVVDESGLPERGDPLEPEGTDETADTETTSGTITFNSPDGVQSVTINGVAITPGSLPQTIVDNATGTLVITDYTYDPVTGDGTITYDYTLGDNTSGDNTSVSFDVVVTDLDGDKAEDDLVITIIDDEPDAIDDSATQSQENAPVTVNVFANDIEGADGVELDTIKLVEGSLTGAGSLVNNGDGTFTYTPAPGEEGDANGNITFQYSITDGDGDSDIATVTIKLLPDSTPEIGAEGADVVDEAGLAARGSEPEGSDEPSDSEFTQGGIFIFTGNDTVGSLVINGVDVTNGGTVTTSKGVLTISLTAGEYSYTYELKDNTLVNPDSDTFNLTVTDSDGDTANTSIVIAIMDDSPEALNDLNSIAAGQYGPVGGNVLANDTQGADGAVVTSYNGTGGSGDAGTVVQGTWGKLTIAADGTYSYTRDPGTPGGVTDTFNYTITDGDGDPASAQLIITIGDSKTSLDLPLKGEAGTLVDEAGLDGPPNGADVGTDAASDSETTDGAFTFTAPDGPATVFIDGVEVTTVGQTFTGDFGTLTITAIGNGTISYSYELTTNTSGDATFDQFVVRVEDQDDDFSEDTLRIDITDDEPLAGENAPVALDDDALGGNPGGTGDTDPDSANLTGTLAHQFGADGAGSITFASMDGQTVDINGVTVTFSWAGDTLTANDGTNDVFTVQVNPATGEYTVTQLAPLNHHASGDDVEAGATFNLTYTVTDGDTDTATGTLTINLNDDTPEFGEQAEPAPTLVTDDTDVDNNGSDSAAGNFAAAFAPLYGADGQASTNPVVYSFGLKAGNGTDSGLNDTVSGDDILLRVNGNVVEGYLANSPTTIAFTLTLDPATGDITQTQLRAIEHDDPADALEEGVNAESMAADVITLTAEITDGDGDQASQSINIGDAFTFADDTGAATDNAKTVTEGSSASGDVVLDDDGNGVDDAGADGFAAAGAVVDAAFVSADQGVTFVSKTVAPDGTITIVTTAGTLTLAADGTYTFAAAANSVNGDAEIVFSYTIEDGDGDQNTANLTIDVTNVGGAATVDALTVDEKGLADGTGELADPALNSDQSEVASGQIVVSGASGSATLTYQLVGGTFNDNGTPGDASDDTYTLTTAYGTIVLQAATGAYTYTLNEEFDHSAGGGRNTAPDVESFDYVVVDEFANVIVDSRDPGGNPIEVSIVDDIPVVAIQLDANADVTLDESGDGAGAATINTGAIVKGNDLDVAGDGAISRATSGTAVVTFAAGNPVYGADGQGPAPVYALKIDTAALTDVTLTDGSTITLQLVGDVIVGVVDSGPFAGQAAFAIAINSSTGVVTVEQYLSLQHPLNPNQDEPIDLDDGAISVVVTVEDFDGDKVTSNAIDISANIVFEDDGPSVTARNIDDNSVVAITSDADLVDTDNSQTLADLFDYTADYGADGQGGAVVETYGIDLLGDTDLGDATVGINSGFTSGNATVYLYQDGNTVVASTAATKGNVDVDNIVFVVAVNPTTGELTLEQSGVLDHTDNGSATDTQLVLANGLINATYSVTITDGDNDPVTDTQTADLGGNIAFNDDVPAPGTATVNVQVDEDELPGGITDGDAVDTEESGSLNALVDFGNDTPGTFAFNLAGFTDPNLTSGGATVNWGIDASGKLVGYTGADITDASSHVIVVELVNTGGNWSVKVSLEAQVDHLPNDPANNDNQTLSFNIGGAIVATDFDGDEITLSNNAVSVTVEDDIPAFAVNTNSVRKLVTDDTDVDNNGSDSDSTSFAGLFTPQYGADGAAAVNPIVYALAVTGGNGTDSGLDDVATGDNILLRLNGNTIEGYLAGSPTTIAFTISVNTATGVVTQTQLRAIEHDNASDPVETGAEAEGMAAGLITISATITDGDTDSVTSAPVNIGDRFTFEDDGPSISAVASGAMVNLDETATSSGTPLIDVGVLTIGNDPDVSGAGFISRASSVGSVITPTADGGADGTASVAYALTVTNAASGVTLTDGSAINLVQLANGNVVGVVQSGSFAGQVAFAITINTTTGVVTVEQYLSLNHPNAADPDDQIDLADGSLGVIATITDGDGDTASAPAVDISANINFDDDGPSASISVAGLSIVHDETPGVQGPNDVASLAINPFSGLTGGDDPHVPGTIIGYATSTGVISSAGTNFGADGGSAVISLTVGANNFSGVQTTEGVNIYLFKQGDIVVGRVGADSATAANGPIAFAIAVDGSGQLQMVQYLSLKHPNAANADDSISLATGALSATVTAVDGDGDTSTASIAIGNLVSFRDDGPANFSPVDLTDTNNSTPTLQDNALLNTGSAVATRLINDPDNDGIGTSFMGADGFGTLTFTGGTNGVTTLLNSGGTQITAGGQPIYLFGFGTGTLIGTTDPTNTDASAKVFTVTLNTGNGTGSDATYTIDFDRQLDDGSGVELSDFSAIRPNNYDWVGFTSEGTLFDGIDNQSADILITALNPTTGVAGTVNMSASDIGSNNQWIDPNESIRIDFVTDGTGAGSEKTPLGYNFDGHYDVNNASFTIIELQGGGAPATIKLRLFDDADAGNIKVLDGSPVTVDVSSIVVKNASGVDVTGSVTITLNPDGSVNIAGLGAGYNVSFEGVTDFNAFRVEHAGGNNFSLGGFGFNSAVTGNPVSFGLDVLATDGDGDTSTGSIDITVVPAGSVPPVVLDLDGGGNSFTPLSGGLAYDYNGDNVKTQTAWVAAGSAILAYDMNGDGIVNNASEFVFGAGDMTDLEAIAAKYDENGDNVLDASDSAYGKFGVWMDDGDAMFEAGEFQTLEQAGIKSIELVSDGIQTSEADGDVTVFGTASFTWMDGSTGAVSDAAFATGSDVDPAMMDALLALQPTAEPAETLLAAVSDGDNGGGLPQLAAIVDDVMAESSIDLMIDNLAGDNADIVGNSGESSYLDGGALAQMIEAGAFAFHGNNAMADTHEDAAVLAAMNA